MLVRFFFLGECQVVLSSRNSCREGRGSGDGFCPASQRTSKRTRGFPEGGFPEGGFPEGVWLEDWALELAGVGDCMELADLELGWRRLGLVNS